MRRWMVAVLLTAGLGSTALAQRLPTVRPTLQPTRKDTTKDSTRFKWPELDSTSRALLSKAGYSITRYVGDTAYFDEDNKVLDLLAAAKHRAAVQRDSLVIVSDSGIYYTQATRQVITGGSYVMSPGGGQADIVAHGRASYGMAEQTFRIRNARLPVNNGDTWFIDVAMATVIADSNKTGKRTMTSYIGGGSMTSCDDTIPDYHFEFREAKRTGENTLTARPAVLYIKDVPVMWLPFLFSDTRPGRHSGLIPPQFGVGDIVRNSPSYRRNVDHFGYYWALSDYMDFSTWLDWRSSAAATAADPGWLKYNFDWDYRWLDRFLGGRIGASYTDESDGQTNLALSWTHSQDFSHDAHFNTNFNYVTSTTLQRQNTFNPYSALATISSQATYQDKLGPASLSIGATRKQYPGRQEIDQTFPTLSLTSTAISLGSHVSWTPNFSFNRSDVLHMDQPGIGAFVLHADPLTGVEDSTQNFHRGSSTAAISFDTPFQIFGYDLRNSFRVSQQRDNFAQQFDIYDVHTGDVTGTRIYAATYYTYVDWNPDFTLPPIGQNRFNLTPSVSLQNVDPGPFWVETERTNGQFVSQSKRLTFGLTASPTFFGFFPGFGPFQRLRHSITPTFGYSYAPASSVSDAYLSALGRSQNGYLGNLKQNALTFGLTQNIEAKVASKTDTSANAKPTVIRLLSITTTPLTYDFERAREEEARGKSAARGLTTETWGYQLGSDLFPGLDFSANYSLFQGSALSDTAVFKPILTNISASFNIGRDQNPLAVFARLFGKAVPVAQATPTPGVEGVRPKTDDATAAAVAAMPVAGSAQSGGRFIIPPAQGWRASFTFSRSSPRTPVGSNVISFDPATRCAQEAGGNTVVLDACLAQQAISPSTDTPVLSGTVGGPSYAIPPTMSLNSNISFNLTPKWSAAWQSTYDLERHEFASHIVSLQRDLHDWRAIFGFTQSPNGNFAFNFTIALKAEPDLKFDYNRATVRSGTNPFEQ